MDIGVLPSSSESHDRSQVECYVCGKVKKKFICKSCLSNRDFVSAKPRFNHISFQEKYNEFVEVKRKKDHLESVQNSCLEKIKQIYKMKSAIKKSFERKRNLANLVKEKRELIESKRIHLAEVEKDKKERLHRIPKYESRVDKVEDAVTDRQEKRARLQNVFVAKITNFQQLQKLRIRQLNQYIFPVHVIESVERMSTHDDAEDDVTHVRFIKGNLLPTSGAKETKYSIVKSSLPSSGDYNVFNSWVSSNKDEVPGKSDTYFDKASEIMASLTYATQLVNIIASYLSTCLPYKVKFSDFCKPEISDKKFNCKVARLNANIIYLCSLNNIKCEMLHPLHTLENIFYLYSSFLLDGMNLPTVDQSVIKYLEKQLSVELEISVDSDSDSDDGDFLHWEWESMPPESELIPEFSQSEQSSSLSASSIAGGIVSNAAASIVSIWRDAAIKLVITTYFVMEFELFQLNRKRLDEQMRELTNGRKSAVLLQGGKTSHFYDTDVEILFRQEPFFMWTFGVTIPDFYGALIIGHDSSALFAPKLSQDYEIWAGRLKTVTDFQNIYGVDKVFYTNQIIDYLRENKVEQIFVLDGTNSDSHLAHFGVDINLKEFQVNYDVLYEVMSELRVFKTDYEIEVMRKASEISSNAHKAVMLDAKPNIFEYELESKFLQAIYKSHGCRFVSYTCICASGTNNQILHYGHSAAPNDKLIKDGDLCLFDMGANYLGYASDITCTFPINGQFSYHQKIIYEIVLKINRAIIECLKPNVSWVQMHEKGLHILISELQRVNIVNRADVNELITAGIGAIFQPHGLGHLVGLDVHDVGGYLKTTPQRPNHFPGIDKLRTARNLAARMCVTVEPGCYFNDCLLRRAKNTPELAKYLNWQMIDKFKHVGGVRIEDVVLITDGGAQVLSKLPRSVEEIEDFMKLHNFIH